MNFLLLESTCDETAAAIVTDELRVLGAAVASQDDLHQRFDGVVPEIAARAHVERIVPVIDLALERSGITLKDVDVIAVANTPGLAGSLVIGLVAAKTLCVALGKPLVAINHIHAHLFACRMMAAREVFPCAGLVVSGGHTTLFDVRSVVEFHVLGGTIDDAAGEAFDKVATMLGLPYPGGPALSRLAEHGDPHAYAFPRSFLNEEDRLEFSFSGLKTAVRYAITGPGRVDLDRVEIAPQQAADLAASFQAAVVDCLVAKARQAIAATRRDVLCVGGGVAANGLLRQELRAAAAEDGFELLIAPPELCTDNAVMGAIAVERWRAGLVEPLDLDITPGLMR